ncbi:MAG: uncharacterized protein KVP18_003902 [Porospora cf. gigantea A]|uniref:uncharacterized protein n=1 Tax=Porospora cf. gigantea A TaxID=2853593 RepID=UPI0035599707|nr:MAG: hypothetical protein KVP18_003902 [Porospora cf. gigantea A]
MSSADDLLLKSSLLSLNSLRDTPVTASRVARLAQRIDGSRLDSPVCESSDGGWTEYLERVKQEGRLGDLEFAVIAALGHVDAVLDENVNLRWEIVSLEDELKELGRICRDYEGGLSKTGQIVESALRATLDESILVNAQLTSDMELTKEELYAEKERAAELEYRVKAYEHVLTRYDKELRFLKPQVVEDWRSIRDARSKKKKTYVNRLTNIFGLK